MTVGDHVRNYLIAEGIVRNPRVAAPGGDPNRPPMWLNPRKGVRAPGEPKDATGVELTEVGADAVVAGRYATPITRDAFEGFSKMETLEVIIRAASSPRGQDIGDLIRLALNDKRGWVMAGLRIEESLETRGFQPTGSDDQAFDFVGEFSFLLWD